jgi:hypothetical protein
MWDDPIVAEVRRARERLAARFDFDVEAIFAGIQNRQAARGRRLVSRMRPVESRGAAEHGPHPESRRMSLPA